MKIGIDISQIVYGTGVSVYTYELVSNLLKIDRENNYVLFGGSLRRRGELAKYTTNILPLSPTIADLVWNRLHIINIEKFIGNIDVFHSSDWTQPPSCAFKVSTIHDLAPIKFPNETPKKVVDVHKRRLYWVLKECDRIIVPTNSIKKDVVELGADEGKIRVTYEGINGNYKKKSRESDEEIKRKFGIHDNFILSVGVGERKNTKRIIDAYQKLKTKNLKLILVGEKSKNYSEIRGVVPLGYVSNNDLASLYSAANALVYPSLYEGFGLPILQAFASETPVVTSNSGSMAEIAGKGAVLVDPQDVNSIAEGIDKAVNSPKTLSRLGLKRVKDFSWEKCAKETLEVYKESTKR